MNLSLNILWLILIVITIVLIILFLLAVNSYLNVKNIEPPSGVSPCNVNFDNLISVKPYNCCVVGSNITPSRYIPSLNMVVNPIAINYKTVCNQFCTEGISENSDICHNNTGQEEYNNCILISKPINNCSSYSMPVAVLDTNYYYPYSATDESCKTNIPC